jgi:hypothetical protein
MKGRAYLALGRPSNLPTVWTNVLAGAVLADAPIDRTLVPILISASLFYVGGMFLNDAFDREIDAKERPERPIPSGKVSAFEAFLAGFLLLGSGVALAVLAEPSAMHVAIALASAIVLYDVWHKKNPLAPVIMGGCRALVYVLSAAALAKGTTKDVQLGATAMLCWVIGLTYVAKQENLATFRGFWPLLLLAVPIFVVLPSIPKHAFTGLAAIGLALWAARAVSLLRRPGNIGRAVVALIAGISLVDATLIASRGETALSLLAMLGLPATIALQRVVRGT